MAKVVWVRRGNDWGAEAVDLHDCRMYDLTNHKRRGPIAELIYYYNEECNTWIRYMVFPIFDNGSWEWREAYSEVDPAEVARDMLHSKSGPLPEELEKYRGIASDHEAFLNHMRDSHRTIAPAHRPRWERLGRGGELYFGPVLCRRYRKEARNQMVILDAFQGSSWAGSIIPDLREEQATQAVKDLMKGLKEGAPIRFESRGHRVLWLPLRRQLP
jgi:hypothetical protein